MDLDSGADLQEWWAELSVGAQRALLAAPDEPVPAEHLAEVQDSATPLLGRDEPGGARSWILPQPVRDFVRRTGLLHDYQLADKAWRKASVADLVARYEAREAALTAYQSAGR